MNQSKNFLIIIFTFFISILFAFVILLMIHVKKTDAIVLVDDLTCYFREEIHVDNFIDDIDGTLLDNYLVDTSTTGKKQLEVRYKNRYGFVEKSKFYIQVLDNTPPVILIDNPYVVEKGKIDNLINSTFCADDYDDHIQCSVEGDYDLNQIGTYSLSVLATDYSGNQSKKDFVLKVVDKKEDNVSSDITKFQDIYKKYSEKYDIGLDISKWQGDVDFSKVSKQGVSFVMIKIGGQSEINGEIFLDPYFETNIVHALENNLKVGIYFYSYAKNENEARKQAKWVVQVLKKYHLDLPVAFDWENWERFYSFGIGFRTLNRVANSFINEINRYDYKGILYSSKYYLENVWYADNYSDSWLAYYNSDMDYAGEFLMWQMCNNGVIDGINGYVDIDLLKK